jgi:PAS domain-containing protein
MNPQLNTQQVFFVLGTAAVIVGVLVLVVIILVKSLRKEKREMSTPFSAPRAQDESLFMISSLQAVVAGLKAREKELESQLREAETRAEVSRHILETVVGAAAQGFVIFDAGGTMGMANQSARHMLGLDAHARRRYAEIFPPDSPLALAIKGCLDGPPSARIGRAKYSPAEVPGRTFDVAIHPFVGRGGQWGGVVCVFTLLSVRDAAST